MRDPNLHAIVNDLTIKGLKELRDLINARLLILGDSEARAQHEAETRF